MRLIPVGGAQSVKVARAVRAVMAASAGTSAIAMAARGANETVATAGRVGTERVARGVSRAKLVSRVNRTGRRPLWPRLCRCRLQHRWLRCRPCRRLRHLRSRHEKRAAPAVRLLHRRVHRRRTM